VSPLTVLTAVGLTAIAAVAVLWPYQRSSAAALQRLADPLEDERRRALRHLRDLDEDRGAGKLDEAGYRDARAEAEARAVAVLRALEAREGTGELAGSLREVRRPAPSDTTRRPYGRLPGRPWPRRAVAALVGVVVVAGAAALLDGAVGDRGTGQLTTGQAATGETLGGPGAASLEGLERRVREHPGDVAAHLTLAERYLDAGRLKEATLAYLGALKLDPSNVEANTQFGLLLFRSGLPEPGSARSSRPWPPTHATRRLCTPRASFCSWVYANPRPRYRAFAPTSRWPRSGTTATWPSSSSSSPRRTGRGREVIRPRIRQARLSPTG
jgi:tetratricopeptide (TPR) repeat protein